MTALNDHKDWVLRVFYYFIFCGTVAAISYRIFSKSNLSHTDVDSARYMLSALIQSEAAIIAIVVTMSLVAVQLAASSYSVRVVDIFRKKSDLWLLLFTYGFAIFWGLSVLKMIDMTNPLPCELLLFCQFNLEHYIVFTYSLGVFVYVALGLYIRHILGMLNPSAIMSVLAMDLTKENILESIKKENEDEANPNSAILPIIDIVRSALMKYDYETTRDGLRTIRVSIKHIFENETFDGKERDDISNHLLNHLSRISRLAIDKGDEYSINEVIKTIQIIGIAAAENKLETMVFDTISNLEVVGIEAAKQNLESPTQMALSAIEKIRDTYVKSYYLFSWGENIEHGDEKLIEYLTQTFDIDWAKTPNMEWNGGGEVIITDEDRAISLRLTDEITKVNLELDDDRTIKLTAKKENGTLNIYKSGFNMRVSGGGWGEVSYLEKIGITAIEHRLENVPQQVAGSLGLIGKAAAENKLTNILSKSITPLETIMECARHEELYYVIETISESLHSILDASAELDESSKARSALEKANAYIEESSNAQKSIKFI